MPATRSSGRAPFTTIGPPCLTLFGCVLQDGTYDLSAPPPFSLSDIRNAIPAHCWNKNAWKSMAYLALDVAVVAGLAVAAYTVNQW